MAQVVECLPSKHKALSSNPSTEEKKNVIQKLEIFVTVYLVYKVMLVYTHSINSM
jgi:hypothetical protein